MRTHCVWQKQVRTAVILMTNHLSDGVKHSLFFNSDFGLCEVHDKTTAPLGSSAIKQRVWTLADLLSLSPHSQRLPGFLHPWTHRASGWSPSAKPCNTENQNQRQKKRHTNIVFIHVSLTLLFFVFCVSAYDVTIHICYSHFAPGWQTHQTRAVSSCHCASKCKKNTAKNGYCVINCTDSESIQTEVFTGGWRLKASAVHWGFLFTRHTHSLHIKTPCLHKI